MASCIAAWRASGSSDAWALARAAAKIAVALACWSASRPSGGYDRHAAATAAGLLLMVG